MKKLIVFTAFILCITFIVCASILVKPYIVYRNAGSISVKGYAVERVESNAATWNAQILEYAPNQKEAFAKIKKSLEISKKFLLETGALENSLNISPITFSNVYKVDNGNRTNQIEYIQAFVNIEYTSDDVKNVVKIANSAAQLAENNVGISSSSPQFFYTKLEDLKLNLIEKAAANARERAQKLTNGSDSSLGKIVSASQGIFQITRPLSNDTSDWGMYDTSSINKDVRCVVSVEFEVEKSLQISHK